MQSTDCCFSDSVRGGLGSTGWGHSNVRGWRKRGREGRLGLCVTSGVSVVTNTVAANKLVTVVNTDTRTQRPGHA